MKRNAMCGWSAAAAFSLLLSAPLFAKEVTHACAGVVSHIDHAGKTMVVRLADGTERTFSFGAKTTWRATREAERGAAKSIVETEMGVTEGARVLVHCTGAGKAGKVTVVELTRMDQAILHSMTGTIRRADADARTLTVKTADGAEHVLSYGGETLVDTGKGVEQCTEKTATALDKMGAVTVHYTESEGRKAVHLIRKVL